MVYPEPCRELRSRTSADICGWNCLLLIIYPGLDSGSTASATVAQRPTAAALSARPAAEGVAPRKLGALHYTPEHCNL